MFRKKDIYMLKGRLYIKEQFLFYSGIGEFIYGSSSVENIHRMLYNILFISYQLQILQRKIDSQAISIFGLILSPKLINCLPQKLHKEVITVTTSHLIVQFCYKPIPKAVAVVQKLSRRHIIFLVPPVTFPPVGGGVVSLQPHKVSNSFYQSSRSSGRFRFTAKCVSSRGKALR